jgi:hypothetical protein
MSLETQTDSPESEAISIDMTWNRLYRVGGVAALLCALMYVITLIVYIPARACYALWPGSDRLQAWNEKHTRVMSAMTNGPSWPHT